MDIDIISSASQLIARSFDKGVTSVQNSIGKTFSDWADERTSNASALALEENSKQQETQQEQPQVEPQLEPQLEPQEQRPTQEYESYSDSDNNETDSPVKAQKDNPFAKNTTNAETTELSSTKIPGITIHNHNHPTTVDNNNHQILHLQHQHRINEDQHRSNEDQHRFNIGILKDIRQLSATVNELVNKSRQNEYDISQQNMQLMQELHRIKNEAGIGFDMLIAENLDMKQRISHLEKNEKQSRRLLQKLENKYSSTLLRSNHSNNIDGNSSSRDLDHSIGKRSNGGNQKKKMSLPTSNRKRNNRTRNETQEKDVFEDHDNHDTHSFNIGDGSFGGGDNFEQGSIYDENFDFDSATNDALGEGSATNDALGEGSLSSARSLLSTDSLHNSIEDTISRKNSPGNSEANLTNDSSETVISPCRRRKDGNTTNGSLDSTLSPIHPQDSNSDDEAQQLELHEEEEIEWMVFKGKSKHRKEFIQHVFKHINDAEHWESSTCAHLFREFCRQYEGNSELYKGMSEEQNVSEDEKRTRTKITNQASSEVRKKIIKHVKAKVAANDYFFLGCASQFGMPYHEEYNNSRSKEQAITYYRKAALLDNDITIRRVAHNRFKQLEKNGKK